MYVFYFSANQSINLLLFLCKLTGPYTLSLSFVGTNVFAWEKEIILQQTASAHKELKDDEQRER